MYTKNTITYLKKKKYSIIINEKIFSSFTKTNESKTHH